MRTPGARGASGPAVAPRSLAARAVLSVALWAGSWALRAGVVGVLAAVAFVQVEYRGALDLGGFLALVLAVVAAWAVRPRGLFRRAPDRPAPLDAAEFPELHALVARVARRVGVRPPDEIQLGSHMNAAMAGERRPFRRHRILALGLPLFGALDEDELSSVVAHELAHERGGDVALGGWVHRTQAGLAAALEALDGSAFWLDLPFRAYGWLFLRVSSAVSRAQELAADACAAAAAGRTAAWWALRKIGVYADAWDVYFGLSVRPALERGLRVPLLDGFARFVAEPRRSAEAVAALAADAAELPSARDTHPSIAARLQAVDPARRQDLREPPLASCAHLLGGPAAAEDAWYSRFVNGTPVPAEWGEAAARGLLPEIGEALAGTPLELSRFGLADLPDLVARAGELWPALRRGVSFLSPAAQAVAVRRAISGALAMALAARGWVPELRPGAALTLRRGGLDAVPDELVAALADGSLSAAGWGELCATWAAAAREAREAEAG